LIEGGACRGGGGSKGVGGKDGAGGTASRRHPERARRRRDVVRRDCGNKRVQVESQGGGGGYRRLHQGRCVGLGGGRAGVISLGPRLRRRRQLAAFLAVPDGPGGGGSERGSVLPQREGEEHGERGGGGEPRGAGEDGSSAAAATCGKPRGSGKRSVPKSWREWRGGGEGKTPDMPRAAALRAATSIARGAAAVGEFDPAVGGWRRAVPVAAAAKAAATTAADAATDSLASFAARPQPGRWLPASAEWRGGGGLQRRRPTPPPPRPAFDPRRRHHRRPENERHRRGHNRGDKGASQGAVATEEGTVEHARGRERRHGVRARTADVTRLTS